MRLLLRSLARNECTTVSNKTLKNDIKSIDDEDIDVDTIADYLNIFSCLFIIENQNYLCNYNCNPHWNKSTFYRLLLD